MMTLNSHRQMNGVSCIIYTLIHCTLKTRSTYASFLLSTEIGTMAVLIVYNKHPFLFRPTAQIAHRMFHGAIWRFFDEKINGTTAFSQRSMALVHVSDAYQNLHQHTERLSRKTFQGFLNSITTVQQRNSSLFDHLMTSFSVDVRLIFHF